MTRDFDLPEGHRHRAGAWLARQEALRAEGRDESRDESRDEPSVAWPGDGLPPGGGSEEGHGDPQPVRPASTVMLLRDAPGGLEVFLLRRVAAMVFAAGMHVFPGGRVDPADADPAVGWVGPDPAALAEVLTASPDQARALVVAAVRETFEECGVLLAGAGPGALVDDVTGPGWETDRVALAAGERTMADVLGPRGLCVRADLLRPWTHWVTPPFEPRRYDTRFFAAAMPAQQHARDVGGESDHAAWVKPAEALRRFAAGEVALMPPTQVCCEELAAAGSVAAVMAAPRRVRPIRPWVVDRGAAGVALRAGEVDGW